MPRRRVVPALVAAFVASILATQATADSGAPPPARGLSGEGFALIADVGGVRVYRREQRPGVELAADGTLAAPPQLVRQVLLDYPHHPAWQKRLKETRVVQRSDQFIDVYQRLDLPILSDRDFTLHVTWGDDGAIAWVRFTAANERGPHPVSGVVRVTTHEGAWRLEPIDGGRATHAVYRFYLDLAGSFPAWLGNGRAASELPEIFHNIAGQLALYAPLEVTKSKPSETDAGAVGAQGRREDAPFSR